MKITKYFLSLIAVLAMMVSCSDEFEPTYLDDIKVSSSYIAIPMDGGSTTIELTTKDNFEITGAPSWLTITPTSGSAGTTNVTFSATPNDGGRTAEGIIIKSGDSEQLINVIQGLTTVSEATCAEVIAGPDAKTYRTKGVVTAIANTVYGNFYINDGTGEVYIYGTLFDGKTQNNPIVNNKIEVGDEVTVEGPKTTYNGTVELVDVTVVNVSKSLMKVDSVSVDVLPIEGGDFTVVLSNKGDGVYVDVPADAKSWLTITGISGNEVKFHAASNEGGDRATTIEFSTKKSGKTYTSNTTITQKGAVAKVTCAEFNAKADGTPQYKVRGIITSIANTKYGNLYINDGTGEVYTYGITDWNADDYKVGDEVELQSVKTSYNGAPQMKNAVCIQKVPHDVKTVAELNELPDDKNILFLVTGTVFHLQGDAYKFDLEQYGNFGLKDETGEIYVYGVADGLYGKTKNFASTGIKEGDNITILAYKTSYKGNNQIVGQFIKKN